MRARIARTLPVDTDDFQAAEMTADAFASAEDTEDETTTEDPFANGGEEGGDDLLTAEELDGMDLKELGGIAKEFDLDPTAAIVKTRGKTDPAKTKAKIIEMILEAQGGEETEEGEEEGNPF